MKWKSLEIEIDKNAIRSTYSIKKWRIAAAISGLAFSLETRIETARSEREQKNIWHKITCRSSEQEIKQKQKQNPDMSGKERKRGKNQERNVETGRKGKWKRKKKFPVKTRNIIKFKKS